jgi:ABC-type sulfate transport system substrate-binding protein
MWQLLHKRRAACIPYDAARLQLFYPDLNIESNHPFAILQGTWVNTEQQVAAKQFRDFLLQIPQQKHALLYGFRPSSTSVQLTDNTVSQNPFLQFGLWHKHRLYG